MKMNTKWIAIVLIAILLATTIAIGWQIGGEGSAPLETPEGEQPEPGGENPKEEANPENSESRGDGERESDGQGDQAPP